MPVMVQAFELISSIFMLASCGWNEQQKQWHCTPYCNAVAMTQNAQFREFLCDTSVGDGHGCYSDYQTLSEAAREIMETEFAQRFGSILLDVYHTNDHHDAEVFSGLRALVKEINVRLKLSRVVTMERKWIISKLKQLVRTLERMTIESNETKSSLAREAESTCTFYYLEALVHRKIMQYGRKG